MEWGPVVNAGFPLEDAAAPPEPELTVAWGPKLGTSFYAYDSAE